MKQIKIVHVMNDPKYNELIEFVDALAREMSILSDRTGTGIAVAQCHFNILIRLQLEELGIHRLYEDDISNMIDEYGFALRAVYADIMSPVASELITVICDTLDTMAMHNYAMITEAEVTSLINDKIEEQYPDSDKEYVVEDYSISINAVNNILIIKPKLHVRDFTKH